MKEKINNTEIRHRSTFAVLFYINRTKVEKPRDFDPFGQTGLSPLATI